MTATAVAENVANDPTLTAAPGTAGTGAPLVELPGTTFDGKFAVPAGNLLGTP